MLNWALKYNIFRFKFVYLADIKLSSKCVIFRSKFYCLLIGKLGIKTKYF